MARTLSRTPIAPHLIHDPAQVALDAARISEIANLIPVDVCERLIGETDRRGLWDLLLHPLEALKGIGLMLVLLPGALARSNRDRRTGPHPSERSSIDMLRGSFAATWVAAIDAALEESHGKPVELSDDLFPSKPPSDTPEFEEWHSWRDYVSYQFGRTLDDRSVAGLMDAFALRMGEVIRSYGRQIITRRISIQWNNVHYIAERIPPRAT